MAHLEFGQDRLAQPHPLQALELAQRPVQSPLEARFVAEQAIQNWNDGNATNLWLTCSQRSRSSRNTRKSLSHHSRFLWVSCSQSNGLTLREIRRRRSDRKADSPDLFETFGTVLRSGRRSEDRL